jgi:hypothetical protein
MWISLPVSLPWCVFCGMMACVWSLVYGSLCPTCSPMWPLATVHGCTDSQDSYSHLLFPCVAASFLLRFWLLVCLLCHCLFIQLLCILSAFSVFHTLLHIHTHTHKQHYIYGRVLGSLFLTLWLGHFCLFCFVLKNDLNSLFSCLSLRFISLL